MPKAVAETSVFRVTTPDHVRLARKLLGLTQAELAEALRMGADGGRAVRRWEMAPERPGAREISGPAAVAIELMLLRKLHKDWFE